MSDSEAPEAPETARDEAGNGDGRAEADLPAGWGGRVKGVAANFALMAFAFAIALAAGEVAVRLVAPQQLIVLRPELWASADSVGWRNAALLDTEVNTGERAVRYVTDLEGFRVAPEGRRVRGDSILLIGDSFMAAQQVEYAESLAGLIEDSLAGPGGQRVAVRNTGVSSWDPWQYRIFGTSRLGQNRYDLMLVAVFVGNDVVRRRVDYIAPRQLARPPRFRIPFSLEPGAWIRGVAAPLNGFLEGRSHLFVFVKNRTELVRIRLGLSPSYIPNGLLRDRAEGEEWEVTAGILSDLEAAASEGGTDALFVLIPAQYQVDRALFTAHAAAFGVDTAMVDLDQPNRILMDELSSRGLDVIDALPAFRRAHEGGASLYGSVDPHFSPAGHRALYELLEEPIRERLTWGAEEGR